MTKISIITLFPCFVLLIVSYIIPIPSEGLKITLVPPHSPESPAYLGNLTVSKKIQKLIRQSRGRAQILSNNLFPIGILNHSSANNDPEDIIPSVEGVNLGGASGFVYVAKIGIGTFDDEPHYQTYYLSLDTGSTLMWLQCAECQKDGNTCFPQVDPLFRNSLSHSFTPVMENSALCTPTPPNPNPRLPCYYDVEYADGAKSHGVLAHESFKFESETPAPYSQLLLFGCGFDQTDFSVKPGEPEKAAGIMGLGRGKKALQMQLDDKHVGLSFSYCFQDLLHPGDDHHTPQRPTYLQFIEDMQEDPSTYQETTFQFPRSSIYFIKLVNIKIDDTHVPIVPLDRVIIDSGSSITYLVQPVYDSIRDALVSWLRKKWGPPRILRANGLEDDPTFCIGKTSDVGFDNLPSIHLILEGGADFEIKREQGFVAYTDDPTDVYFCLMIEPHETLSIIGAFQQVNHKILYDMKQKKLLFKNEDCWNSIYINVRSSSRYRCLTVKCSNVDVPKRFKRDSIYVDKRGKFRSFNKKKLSRKRCGGLRGRGWKFGSGFIDGVFPVLSPIAQKIIELLEEEADRSKIWSILDTLPATHDTWDDLMNVSVQLRLNKKWDLILELCQWILQRSSFKPDIMSYNLIMDAFGQKLQHVKAESVYLELLEARCIPTEDTYSILLRTYCASGLFAKAEAIFTEMRKFGLHSSADVYNAYIEGLIKGGNTQKALEIYQRMNKESCKPTTDTFTMLINLYGKANKSYMAFKVFNEMRTQKCKPNICTYTALINAFARDGHCEKAEEIFELLQEDGFEPDVYAYNALIEAYSRAGYPYGAAEIFSLMQHMGCEPDRASYNIMVDAYGRAGLVEDAEEMFLQLKQRDMTPTMKSHMLLLCAYSKAGNVAKCEDFVNEMIESGIEPDTYLMNSMLNLYGRLGQFEKMEQVLNAMQEKRYTCDLSTYNILINIYGRAGYFEKMEELFHSLRAKDMKPDVVTWTSRLGAYSRKKQYKVCLEIFEEMIDDGCFPDGGTAKVLLSSCSSEDQIKQVTMILRTMHKDEKPVTLENKL
ncbi:hypothetical protein KSS87_001334 [Heliosperma pusillum]|nr:hypothetical protein KSS87_001334 [Heliosperma pusillum]